MANKRMFSREILEHDNFTELSHSAIVLYFYLNLAADNEGFVNSKRHVMRLCGCTEKDLQELIAGNWVILFDTGVLVITHWRIHNTLKNDRCNSIYIREKSLLTCVDRVYFLAETLRKQTGNDVETLWNIEERKRKEDEKKRNNEVEHEQEGEGEGEVQEGEIRYLELPDYVFEYAAHENTQADIEACIMQYEMLVGGKVYSNYQKEILNIAKQYGAYTFTSAISLLKENNLDYSLSNIRSICYAAQNGLKQADIVCKTKSR